MNVWIVLFWCALGIVFYTFFGYGIVLFILVKIKGLFCPQKAADLPLDLPDITLLIAAYNEEMVVAAKMANCQALDYPTDKLHIVWVTDGSTDRTNALLAQYPHVKVLFSPERKGKSAALNHAMTEIRTPLVAFSDANTMLNREAVKEIVLKFQNPKVGCVAGEKRIDVAQKDNASSGGEGFYWKYESKLKTWDSLLYSAVGAAGELFAIRTPLFETLPDNTLLDDFVLSMRITMKGYTIAYCDTAYALETASADLQNEQKRKIRIAAGGLQSIARLTPLLNPLRYGTLSFQYISHRVLRWTIAPILFFALFPLNLWIALQTQSPFYTLLFGAQCAFYLMGSIGAFLQKKEIKVKLLFIPCYFIFMNINLFYAIPYLCKHRQSGTWEKAKRAS